VFDAQMRARLFGEGPISDGREAAASRDATPTRPAGGAVPSPGPSELESLSIGSLRAADGPGASAP
jgi:hypothetical protein